MVGPGQLESPPEAVRAQTLKAMPGAGQFVGQAHVLELADGTGGQAVTARLLAGIAFAFDQNHVMSGGGQPVGARRT